MEHFFKLGFHFISMKWKFYDFIFIGQHNLSDLVIISVNNISTYIMFFQTTQFYMNKIEVSRTTD